MKRIVAAWIVVYGVLAVFASSVHVYSVAGEDWPMRGRDGTRNSVSTETGGPTRWSMAQRQDGRPVRGAQGIKWTAKLGSQTHSSPVVSDGFVWIGTNDYQPDVKSSGYGGVLKCFQVTDGELVYEYQSPQLLPRVHDAGWTGLGSSPLIERDRLWLTTNRQEVLCLDIGPLLRGEGKPHELWRLDLIKKFDVFAHVPLMGPPCPCSIGPSWNGRIFVTINNGVDQSLTMIPKPTAPSLVCLDKETGAVQWTDNSPGANVLTTQFASPTVAEIAGRVQVIVPQGDGWVRAFEPLSGKLIWEFDINPKISVYSLGGRSDRNSLLGSAVVYDNRVFIASGMDAERGEGPGRLVCIDPTRQGDISSELAVDAENKPLTRRRIQAVNVQAGEKSVPNPNSGLVWETTNAGKKFEETTHRMMNSVAVANGLVIATEGTGLVHCLDAKTGQHYWSHDSFATIWTAPLIVNDKVYVTDEDGDVMIFVLSADPAVAMEKVSGGFGPRYEMSMEQPIYSSPSFSNGVLYLATRTELFAISNSKDLLAEDLPGGSWPQWRGPNRNNISTETGLLAEWPADGPPLMWRADGIGDGITSVSIAEGKIYTLGHFEGGEYVTAVDQRTGESVWASRLGPHVNENPLMRWLSQRSPTLDGERLYAITSSGRMVCMRTSDGRVQWSKNYPDDYASPRPKWGFCDYPLVDGDRLICTPGGPQVSVVALDKVTGEERWRSLIPEGGRAAYAALVAIEVDGIRQYVTFLEKGLFGLRASDGKLLWSYNNTSNNIANSHTPIHLGDHLLAGNGYNKGFALLKLTSQGEEVSVNELSFQRQNIDAFQDTSLVYGDTVYLGAPSLLSCIDWKNSAAKWTQRIGSGRNAFIYADNRLYVRSSLGRMRLVDVSPAEYIERGSFQIPDAIESSGATAPVIAGRRLYLRDENKLLCYDLRKDAPEPRLVIPRTIQLPLPPGAMGNPARERRLRSVFVPTPPDVVEKMLDVAQVKESDVLFDLGSGDGRIVLAAARKYRAHAVGFELDKELIESSRDKAKADGIDQLATFEHRDLFFADLSKANVIAVYLLPAQLQKLVPQLKVMKPGSRLVSHQFPIPGVVPSETVRIKSIEDGVDHAVYLYQLPLPGLVRTIEWPENHIFHTAFSPDGKFFLGGGDSGTLRIWDVANGKPLLELPVSVGVFMPDNKQILGHTHGKRVQLFDVNSGQQVRQWETGESILSLALSADGKQVVTGHTDNLIRLWDLATGKEIRQFSGHTGPANVVISPDGRQILSASTDRTIRLWNLETGQAIRTFSDFQNEMPNPGHDLIAQGFFLPEGRVAGYVWGQDKSLLVWNSETGEMIHKLDLGADHHKDVSISPNGKWLISCHEDRTVRVRELATGNEVCRYEMAGVNVPRSPTFSPDSRFVVAGSHRGRIFLWQVGL